MDVDLVCSTTLGIEGWPHRRWTGHWQVRRRRCFWKALFSFLVAFPSCSIDIKTFLFSALYAHLDQNASSEACTLLHKRLNSSRRPLCSAKVCLIVLYSTVEEPSIILAIALLLESMELSFIFSVEQSRLDQRFNATDCALENF